MKEVKEVTVTLTVLLDEEQQEKLAHYVALRREYDVACFPGVKRSEKRYTDEATLAHMIGVAFSDAMLDEAISWQKDTLQLRKERGPIQLDEPQSERDGEAGDVPTRNPSPDEAGPEEPETVSNAEEITVMLELDKWQLKKLDEFAALRRKTEIVPRPDNCYTHEATLQYIFRVASFDAMVDEATAWEKGLLKNRKEAVSEFWEVEPLEDDEAEPDESETFSDPGELPHVETLVPFGEPEEPETLIPIRDADGVRRMATLDEVEAMREAAQGIYEGRTPEPKEPETFSNAEELPAVRRGPLMDDKSDLYFYLLEGRNAV